MSDLIDYVGKTVATSTWRELQAECRRRHGATWTFHVDRVKGGWHVRRLTAKAEPAPDPGCDRSSLVVSHT